MPALCEDVPEGRTGLRFQVKAVAMICMRQTCEAPCLPRKCGQLTTEG